MKTRIRRWFQDSMNPVRSAIKPCWVVPAFLWISSFSHAEEVTFNRDVRPILSKNCFACHGFDEKKRKADLRLDVAEGAVADLGGYKAFDPGKLDASEAWLRITSSDEDEIMPPPEDHEPLTEAQKTTIKRWIEQGAKYEEHWSFIAPAKSEVPGISGAENPIDAFLQARLKLEDLAAAPLADKGNADSTGNSRPHRAPADSGGSGCLSRRSIGNCLGEAGRWTDEARHFRRAHGALLARSRALRRHSRPPPR